MFENKFVKFAGGLMVVVLLASTSLTNATETKKGPSEGKEKKLTTQQIPAVVKATFENAYPKAVIKRASQEIENGATLIERESVEAGVKRDVQYTPDGKVVEVEESVKEALLPEAARQTINKEYAKGKVEKVERVTRGETTQFEVLIAVGKNRTELEFDDSGKTVKTKPGKKDKD